MSITSAIQIAASGLTTSARRADIVSGNIANATTPGYVQRTVELTEQIVGGQGAGVVTAGIDRTTSPVLTADRRQADAETGNLQARSGALERLARAVGEPGSSNSLSAVFERLETAFRDLAETPESAVQQQEVVKSAQDVAGALNQLSTENARVRMDADAEISRQVDEVNEALRQLERINQEIQKLGASGRDVSALEDERQRLIDGISQRIPIRVIRRDQNDVMLLTNEGVPLFDGKAAQVSFQAASAIAPTTIYNGGAGPLSGLLVEGRDIAPGSGDNQSIREGSLAGLFAVRDTLGPDFQGQIDALAEDLISRFSDPATDPTLALGAPGLFTDAGSLPGAPPVAGLAGRIAVNAAVDPDAGGEIWRVRDGIGAASPGPAGSQDGPRRFVDALTQARTLPAALGLTQQQSAGAAFQFLTSDVAISAGNLAREAEEQASFAAGLAQLEKNETGVNIDQELQTLTLIEQAYSANALVVQTADRMVQTLLNFG